MASTFVLVLYLQTVVVIFQAELPKNQFNLTNILKLDIIT
jgi:hypothetical protein